MHPQLCNYHRQDHGENAMIRLQRLAQNAPHQPLEEGYEQAGSSSLQLPRESTPHATFGPDILQSTQPITNAKSRLLRRSVPGYVQAKRGMGQQKLGQKLGNLLDSGAQREATTGSHRAKVRNTETHRHFPPHAAGCGPCKAHDWYLHGYSKTCSPTTLIFLRPLFKVNYYPRRSQWQGLYFFTARI